MTRWLCALVLLLSLASMHAQEGYPLVGTWYGEWGPSAQERHDVTVIRALWRLIRSPPHLHRPCI